MNLKISVANHMQFYFFSAAGLAVLEGSFLLSVKSAIESTSHYSTIQPLVSKATEVKDEENEEFAPAVKCLCGPTLTVRGGKYSLSCVPEGENWS